MGLSPEPYPSPCQANNTDDLPQRPIPKSRHDSQDEWQTFLSPQQFGFIPAATPKALTANSHLGPAYILLDPGYVP